MKDKNYEITNENIKSLGVKNTNKKEQLLSIIDSNGVVLYTGKDAETVLGAIQSALAWNLAWFSLLPYTYIQKQ